MCIVLAGIDLVLRLFLVERRNKPTEWFKNDASTPTVVPSTLVGDIVIEEKNKHTVTYLQLLRQPRLIAGMLLSFSNGCVYNVFEPTLTVRLSTEWGYNASQIGLVFLAQVIPTFVATPASGILSDKFGPKVVCFTNLLICAICMFLIGIPSHDTPGGIVPLIVIFAIQGFTAFSFVVPVLSEMAYVVQEQNPDGGDSGQGMSYSLFNIGKETHIYSTVILLRHFVAFALGGLVGPLAGGYLFSAVGFFNMCVIVGCFLLVCCPYVYIYTGPKGNFIVRPQDRVVKRDEEIDVTKTIDVDYPIEPCVHKEDHFTEKIS